MWRLENDALSVTKDITIPFKQGKDAAVTTLPKYVKRCKTL